MLKVVIGLIVINFLLLILSITSIPNAISLSSRTILTKTPESTIPTLVLLDNSSNDLYRNSPTSLDSSCYSLGPFNSSIAAQQVGRHIRDYGLAFEIRSIRSLETLRYLVYIPPFENQAQAQQTTQDLQKYGIKEVNIITAGRYKNAISVGFYSNLTQARRETQHVRYLGYDAHQSEEKSPLEVFWINYDEPFGSNTPVMTWSRSIEPTATIQRIPRNCG